MTELPMKSYWLGQDIDALPRETLLEIIHHLSGELERTRERARADVKFFADVARRR